MKKQSILVVFPIVMAFWLGSQLGVMPTVVAQENEALRKEVSPEISGKPIIAIASLTDDRYVRAVLKAGGIPIVLPNTDENADSIAEYLELADGLLLPGGPDIPPAEFGEEPHPTSNALGNDRYLFEKALIAAWTERTDKPLLGICLGSQWINVAHGGSLVQDIPSALNVNHRGVTHQVEIEPDSRLAAIFGETEFEVNSFHHQAVNKLGNGLCVVARCPDGIVEGTETTNPNRFLIGVQWHPEKMPENELQQKLFSAFITACAEHSGKRAPREKTENPVPRVPELSID